jgi:hypothetical protein
MYFGMMYSTEPTHDQRLRIIIVMRLRSLPADLTGKRNKSALQNCPHHRLLRFPLRRVATLDSTSSAPKFATRIFPTFDAQPFRATAVPRLLPFQHNRFRAVRTDHCPLPSRFISSRNNRKAATPRATPKPADGRPFTAAAAAAPNDAAHVINHTNRSKASG